MSVEDKEPAFPRNYNADGHNGMTMRDYFAGQALAGMLTSRALALLDHNEQARTAYAYADAMLEARKT